jgi:hypothetical protein
MPRKMRNPKARINIEITDLEREWFLDEGWGALPPGPSAERQKELWAVYDDELLAAYRQKNGLFCRPEYWWKHEAPEPRKTSGDDTETQKAYFLRYPELQTADERQWLKTHLFTRWELMPVSEMTDIKDYESRNFRDLLTDAEFVALQEHIKVTAPADPAIQ